MEVLCREKITVYDPLCIDPDQSSVMAMLAKAGSWYLCLQLTWIKEFTILYE